MEIVLASLSIAILFIALRWNSIRSDKARARMIFKIFQQMQLSKADCRQEVLFKEIALRYFQARNLDEEDVQWCVKAIFEERFGRKELRNIKDLADAILFFEDFRIFKIDRVDFNAMAKRSKVVNNVYTSLFGEVDVENRKAVNGR